MGEIGDQPPLVGRGDAEQIGDLLREPFDTQTGIEKQSTEIDRRHQILQIAMGAGNRFELEFEFAVDGAQLFVGSAQYLVSSVRCFTHGTRTALTYLRGPLQPPHGAAFRPRCSAAVRVIVVRHDTVYLSPCAQNVQNTANDAGAFR